MKKSQFTDLSFRGFKLEIQTKLCYNYFIMKNTIFTILVLTAALSFSFSANAASEDWTYDGLSNIFQVVADGKGGCAIVRSTNSIDNSELVWLDKKGQQIYQTTISNCIRNSIINCSSKQLLFTDFRPTPVFIQVDNNGTESVVPSPAGKYNMLPATGTTPLAVINTKIDDKKGFFLVRSSTNQNGATLIRYKNK